MTAFGLIIEVQKDRRFHAVFYVISRRVVASRDGPQTEVRTTRSESRPRRRPTVTCLGSLVALSRLSILRGSNYTPAFRRVTGENSSGGPDVRSPVVPTKRWCDYRKRYVTPSRVVFSPAHNARVCQNGLSRDEKRTVPCDLYKQTRETTETSADHDERDWSRRPSRTPTRYVSIK